MDRQSNRFSWHPGIVGPDQEVSALITLVQSFSDTGLVQARVRDAIFSQLPHHELGEFDIDLLLDHRDSRQPIIFDTDHFEGYERPPPRAARSHRSTWPSVPCIGRPRAGSRLGIVGVVSNESCRLYGDPTDRHYRFDPDTDPSHPSCHSYTLGITT